MNQLAESVDFALPQTGCWWHFIPQHHPIVAAERGKRILANCEIIWGKQYYDLGEETDDWVTYFVFVREDLGTEFGPLLMFTMKDGKDEAWDDLDRMLGLRAREVQRRRGQQPQAVANPQSMAGGNGGPVLGQDMALKFGDSTQKLK
ncbi:hypothetical protein PG996_002929 [Apiospora saccharicola]|uniref:Uncharacterized protein n=1 Tax=Apiospora saccharicola TaxID=335842 RepID=A0ABR1WKW2_9PEZI